MKRNFFILCLVVALLLGSFSVFAQEAEVGKGYADGILSYEKKKASVATLQELVDGALTEGAGTLSEWYVLALSRYDKTLDFSRYATALEAYLADRNLTSASSRQKYALALVATGRENAVFVQRTLSDSVGKQGIMSYVYGLHFLNNSLPVEGYTVDSVLDALLSLCLADGGWALNGDQSDVDVTAMVLQALAPHYEKENVKSACDKALAMLSQKQLADGDFQSYGVANPESSSQVLMALCSLGINCFEDARFIKNGNTVLDGILKYRLADGSYCHTINGASSHIATVQSFSAFVALSLLERGEEGFYLYEGIEYSPQPLPDEPDGKPSDTPSEKKNPYLWKFIAIASILLLGGVAMGILYFKKSKKKDRLWVFAVTALLLLVVALVKVESYDDFYTPDEPEDPVGKATLTIRCDTVAGKKGMPLDGVLLPLTEYAFGEGETVYDLLLRGAKKEGLRVEASSGVSAYVYGIEFLYEFDFGELSGWVYTVNGERPSMGCDSYRLKDGDAVVFYYSLSLGNEVGGNGP